MFFAENNHYSANDSEVIRVRVLVAFSFPGEFLMVRLSHFAFFLFSFVAIAGCGDQSGDAGTDDEIKAYVDEHGSTSDPGPSPLTD